MNYDSSESSDEEIYPVLGGENFFKTNVQRNLFEATARGRKKKSTKKRVAIHKVSELNPLLKGTKFYKKFANSFQLTADMPDFNAFKADNVPPEACGYGIRELKLDSSLRFFRFYSLVRKRAVETVISVSDIVRVIVPAQTSEMIKIIRSNPDQFYCNSNRQSSNTFLSMNAVTKSTSKQDPNTVRRKIKEMTLFPFSLAIRQHGASVRCSGRIDLVATSYESFIEWTAGLKWLLTNKNELEAYVD